MLASPALLFLQEIYRTPRPLLSTGAARSKTTLQTRKHDPNVAILSFAQRKDEAHLSPYPREGGGRAFWQIMIS
jgi:hypothetical protein